MSVCHAMPRLKPHPFHSPHRFEMAVATAAWKAHMAASGELRGIWRRSTEAAVHVTLTPECTLLMNTPRQLNCESLI